MTKLTIFYDGNCPLCAKEMNPLRQHDHKQEINTVDLYSDAFSAYPQIDPDRANTILHALDNHGNLLLGLDVTYRAWQLVGRGWLVVCTTALATHQTCCGLALSALRPK